MRKIVFLDADTIGADIDMSPISSLGEYISYPFTTPQEVFERIKDCDVLIVNKVIMGKEQIDAAQNLKLICVAATGTNNIDIPYANSKGVIVKNAIGYSTDSVVQITFSLVMALVNQIAYFDDAVKSGKYSNGRLFTDVSKVFWQLKGKKYGVVGLGNIGSRVAKIAEAFGMEVVYYPTSGKAHSDEFKAVSLDELMKECDIVSIHAPLNERTNDLIKYEHLKQMKKSAYIINLGRGGIINEADLVQALNEELIAGAGVDVFTKEPLPKESPYFNIKDMSKVILTPHIGWASQEARTCLVEKIAENIRNNS
ncbi:MAG: D-2-hydroxyacid dehydrogenase [Bacteroidales bacterium]|nr:D-2-hydroxyacid dehydrogenase [Bacteroidales bacterium]